MKDETIDRGENKEGKAGYRYSFSHKIPVENCFAELKKRVESGDIEFDSLSKLVNEYLTDENSRIINYRNSEQNGKSSHRDSDTEILTNARHIEERVTTQENCCENDVEEEESPEFTISTLKLCISEINSTAKKTLDVICTYPRCSAKQIAKFVGTKSTSLSRYFNQLQDLHLIDYKDLDDISDENRGRGSRHYSVSNNLNCQTIRKIIHTPELVTDSDPVYDIADTDSTDFQLLQKEVSLGESPKTQIKNAIDVICNFLTVQDEALVIEAKLKSAKKQIKAYEQILGEEFMDLLTDRARQSAERE